MANTYADYTGDGSNTDFAITFDYIKTAHVAVEINDGPAGGTNKWVRKTLTSDYTVVTSPAKKVVFNSAPANLVKVRVLRDSDANTGIVDFANGSVLTETELDNSYQHNRYLAEEAEEGKTGGALVKNETSGQFDADALRLENLADPDSDDDAVNKGYADARYVDVAGDTMTGALDMGANKVTSSATPSSGNDLTNKTYTDATFVDVAGDTMSGALNLVDPTADDHAAKKKYVDDQDALQVTKTGDTMSGNLVMSGNDITSVNSVQGLVDPTSDDHAARKKYVDDTITTSFATGSPPPGNEIGTSVIEDDAVTFAKLQNLAQNTVIGSVSVGSNDPKALSMTELRAALNVEDGATADQNASEIKTAYESNTNTNAFTDAEQTKLTGIATNANNYVHPTTDGNLHVPATGTTNNGKVLTAGATAGSFSWQTPSSGTFTRNTVTNHNNSTKSGNVSFITFTGTWTGSGNAEDAFTFIIDSAKIGNISNTLVTLNTSLFPSSGDLTVNSGDLLVVHDFIYFDPLMTTGTAPTGIIGAHLPVFNDRTNQLIGRAKIQQQLSSLPTNSGVNTTLHLHIHFNQSVLFNQALGNGIGVGTYPLISKA